MEHTTLNEVGNFLIQVSTDEVGSSVSKELRRLNKRWRKFITKTQLVSFFILFLFFGNSIVEISFPCHTVHSLKGCKSVMFSIFQVVQPSPS